MLEELRILKDHGLAQLTFNRESPESFRESLNYAIANYEEIKDKLKVIKKSYQWDKVLDESLVNEIYS